VDLIPGVCGVVKGSIHPAYFGVEAGLSATGDIFDAVARRAGLSLAALAKGLDAYRAIREGIGQRNWQRQQQHHRRYYHRHGMQLPQPAVVGQRREARTQEFLQQADDARGGGDQLGKESGRKPPVQLVSLAATGAAPTPVAGR